jgi:hypothetical protein
MLHVLLALGQNEEPGRHAPIVREKGDRVPFPLYEFSRYSCQFFDLLFSHDFLEIDSPFQHGSVVQLLSACQDKSFGLTTADALGIDLLCIYWQADKVIDYHATDFIENYR